MIGKVASACTFAVLLGVSGGPAFAQAWYDISEGSKDSRNNLDNSEIDRCEDGRWVTYYRPNRQGQYERHAQAKACKPDGAECRWYERKLPNGSFQRKFMCTPGVKR